MFRIKANQKAQKVNSRVKEPNSRRAARNKTNKNKNSKNKCHNNRKLAHSPVEVRVTNKRQARTRNHLVQGVKAAISHRRPKQSWKLRGEPYRWAYFEFMLKFSCLYCEVPNNIWWCTLYLYQGWLFGLYPLSPGIPSLASYFPFTNLANEISHPLRISNIMTILGVGTCRDIFCTCEFVFALVEISCQ